MKGERKNLYYEAVSLIEESELEEWEKTNLKSNIECFLSRISKDVYVRGCYWKWFNETEEEVGEKGRGLDLVWDRKDVKGCYGFYTDNGHGYSFEYGTEFRDFQFGGTGGEHGFFCEMFIDDFENTLRHLGYDGQKK